MSRTRTRAPSHRNETRQRKPNLRVQAQRAEQQRRLGAQALRDRYAGSATVPVRGEEGSYRP